MGCNSRYKRDNKTNIGINGGVGGVQMNKKGKTNLMVISSQKSRKKGMWVRVLDYKGRSSSIGDLPRVLLYLAAAITEVHCDYCCRHVRQL
ncbi:four helix bundle protein [Sesbania bispinosa]|nr:four helix bundle protein [Sesbania bispinosa]